MRFLDKGDGDEKLSESILELGVQKTIKQVRWDQEQFRNRGGMYDRAQEKTTGGCSGVVMDKNLQW